VIRPLVLALLVALGASLAASPASAASEGPRTHTVYPGQTLGKIAKRYNVSIEQLCAANGLRRNAPIKPGQKLLVPDKDGRVARPDQKRTGTWKDYASPPRRKGYVVLEAPTKRWRGFVVGSSGRVLPKARESIERMFASWRTGKRHPIDPKLIQLVVKVSDTFGGRPIRVVSGYRERSYAVESKHRVGRALDFSIPGVPNAALRDYLRTLGPVGVGFYPNSTHVHLDVREKKTYWVDSSTPGAPPEYLGRTARTIEGPADGDADGQADGAEPTAGSGATDERAAAAEGPAALAPAGGGGERAPGATERESGALPARRAELSGPSADGSAAGSVKTLAAPSE
jgi:LysM repeat protein